MSTTKNKNVKFFDFGRIEAKSNVEQRLASEAGQGKLRASDAKKLNDALRLLKLAKSMNISEEEMQRIARKLKGDEHHDFQGMGGKLQQAE